VEKSGSARAESAGAESAGAGLAGAGLAGTGLGGAGLAGAGLAVTAARARPVTGAEDRLVEVPAALTDLFPRGGIRRGTTMAVESVAGGGSIALSLAATVTAGGGWAAAIGLPSLGLVAAAELGVDLGRLALVPTPGEQWATVVAALVDGFDLLMVRPPGVARPVEARRLAARVREKGAVMLVMDALRWPESPELRLKVDQPQWEGLGVGHGCLTGRRAEVVVSGRRSDGRERRRRVWLPAAGSGQVEEIDAGGGGEPVARGGSGGVSRLPGVGVAG
jgi:hypothetical protein